MGKRINKESEDLIHKFDSFVYDNKREQEEPDELIEQCKSMISRLHTELDKIKPYLRADHPICNDISYLKVCMENLEMLL